MYSYNISPIYAAVTKVSCHDYSKTFNVHISTCGLISSDQSPSGVSHDNLTVFVSCDHVAVFISADLTVFVSPDQTVVSLDQLTLSLFNQLLLMLEQFYYINIVC